MYIYYSLRVFAAICKIYLYSLLSWTIVLHSSRIPTLLRSSSRVSIHLFLGHPRGFLPVSLHSSTTLTTSSLFLRFSWSSHCIRWSFMKLLMGASPISSCNCLLSFLLHAFCWQRQDHRSLSIFYYYQTPLVSFLYY